MGEMRERRDVEIREETEAAALCIYVSYQNIFVHRQEDNRDR